MRKHLRFKASILLLVFLADIFSPLRLLAITSGPSQPEMATFTPAGTTELVDPFTGDFSYNIPLMDVEGYPINIAYNSGVTMEQEASWVGLGWNLNVGTINRSVRGLPDDFKGDQISSKTNMKDLKITKVGGGFSTEIFGTETGFDFQVGKNLSFINNSYKGFGIERGFSMGPKLNIGGFSANAQKGVKLNSHDGASTSSSLGISLSIMNENNSSGFSIGGNMGTGYNTRTGQKMKSFGTTAGYVSKNPHINSKGKFKDGNSTSSTSFSTSYLPVGLNSYTPYPNVSMTSSSKSVYGSVGGEFSGVNFNGNFYGSESVQSVEQTNVTEKGYGYIYSEFATEKDQLDFNRGKSTVLNKTISNLPTANFTYDVYSVSGQGVSGTFRPFRNDIGILGDPEISVGPRSNSQSFGAELGLGSYMHGGANNTEIEVTSNYGSWSGGAHASL